jgi:hypothetical protein
MSQNETIMLKKEMTMRKNDNALLTLALAFICLMALWACATPDQTRTVRPDQTGTVQHEGKKVQISIGEIGKDDKGHTTVEILTDFEVAMTGQLSFAERDIFFRAVALKSVMKAIRVGIVAKNKTFEAFSVIGEPKMSFRGEKMSAKFERIVYHFDTDVLPEKIIVYNKQGPDLSFDGKTKKII